MEPPYMNWMELSFLYFLKTQRGMRIRYQDMFYIFENGKICFQKHFV
jgi:hypothetical protein